MESVEIGKHKINIYSGIEDMSIDRYNRFNMYLLRDSGVGSTMHDIMIRLAKIDKWLEADNIELARIERRNLQLTLFACINQINFKQMAFVCLIIDIDGDQIEDLSDDGILKVIEDLKAINITQGQLNRINIKKKMTLKTS